MSDEYFFLFRNLGSAVTRSMTIYIPALGNLARIWARKQSFRSLFEEAVFLCALAFG